VSFSYLNGLTAVGNTLYFIANDTAGYELWKSDGTTAGTIQAMDFNPGRASGASQILDERMGLI
jgi:ELWxxDGT repeat protein